MKNRVAYKKMCYEYRMRAGTLVSVVYCGPRISNIDRLAGNKFIKIKFY